jgi:hypothetical protein
MKKFLVFLFVLVTLHAYSQDSTKITVNIQARDAEYISFKIYNNYNQQELFDSIKAKVRVQNPPTGNTTFPLTGYTADFILLFDMLNNDELALKGGTTSRLETLLRAINQSYLTGKIDILQAADQANFGGCRAIGRQKSRRQ